MRRYNKGFTLVELLVAMGVMAVVSTAMFAMFATSRQTLIHGSNHFFIQQVARYTVDRLTPLLQTAVPVNDTTPAVLELDGATATLGSQGQSIGFSTTVDFLADPQPVFNPRNPIYYFYEVAFEPTNNHTLVLRKMSPAATGSGNPRPLTAFSPTLERTLTHGEKKATMVTKAQSAITLKDVTFRWERQGGIQIAVAVDGPVRTAENGIRNVEYKLDTRIQFPYYANR